MRVATVLGAALMLAGCGHLPLGHKAVPRGGETITYWKSGCMGDCRSFTITLGPDGQGIFTEGMKDSRFQASPVQILAFRKALAPYRPKGERQIVGGQPGCEHWVTDQQSVQVIWTSVERMSRLVYSYGCKDGGDEPLRSTLNEAPALLSISELSSPH